MDKLNSDGKKYYRDMPSLVDPSVKCPIRESEICLDLEERIRKTEDAIELAALVQAWCQVTRKFEEKIQVPPEVQMSADVKEIMIGIFMFTFGVLTAIGFLMLSARL